MITAEECVRFTSSGVSISASITRTRCSGVRTDFYDFAHNSSQNKIGKSLIVSAEVSLLECRYFDLF